MTFLRLPIELLFLIQSELDDGDVLSHVCFLKLSPQTAGVYDLVAHNFWEKLCRKSGIGLLASEARGPTAYKNAAVECAEHAWTCQHPVCGRQSIASTVADMSCVLDYDPLRTVHEGEHYFPLANDVFRYITFRGNEATSWCRAYLTGVLGDINGLTEMAALEAHPTVLRLFATFSPCDVVSFGTFEGVPPARNENGVTVGDVIDSLKAIMFHVPTTKDLSTWIHHHITTVPPNREPLFPATWSITDILDAVPSVLAWFSVVRWLGFDYGDLVDSRDLNFYFAPRQLPRDPRSFSYQVQDED
ncbi:hypothetical protein PsYK624_158270 [Phanerochaete sordida]|uniref:Uncharacterized protein n=1 Tax=Phanerochaete sordida TaxID=48140 RepID=A0A9P3GPX6_9APHY|nr:hypothetical protein PsYK624_158270 [Phanerochaete sordida]